MTKDVPVWSAETQREIGARMREARDARGASLRALAPKLGVGHAALGHWETGKNAISLPELWMFCALLDVSADKVLFGLERWPFEKVSYEKVADLEPDDRARIEGAILALATQLGVDVEIDKTPPRTESALALFTAVALSESASLQPTAAKGRRAAEARVDSSPPRARKQKA